MSKTKQEQKTQREVYQIRTGNKDIIEAIAIDSSQGGFKMSDGILFDTKETAEAVMNTFNALAKDGVDFKWECEIIPVYDKKQALEMFLERK